MTHYRSYFGCYSIAPFFISRGFIVETIDSHCENSNDSYNNDEFRKGKSPGIPKSRETAWANDLQIF